MEYSLMIDQLALRKWHKKIDATDALLVAFISKLSPHNPEIAKYMKKDFFRLSRSWILAELPLLTLSPDRLGKRLKELEKLGLLDLDHPRDQGGHLQLYGKMSRLFYHELEKAKRETEKTLPSFAPTGADANRRLGQIPQAQTTDDHINDHKSANAAAPLGGAAGVAAEEVPAAAPGLKDRLALLTGGGDRPPELSNEEYERTISAERAARAGLHARNCDCQFCKARREPVAVDNFEDDVVAEATT